MNTIGGDVLAGLNKAIDLAEKDFQGLVESRMLKFIQFIQKT